MVEHAPNDFRLIGVGASAGGIEPVVELVSRLPRDISAAVLVVVHRPLSSPSHLVDILTRGARMKVAAARHGEQVRPGVCLIAPPDRHLTLDPQGAVELLPDHFYRSHSIDALFWSLARFAGPRSIGVILSGLLKDGTLGLRAIKQSGGVAMVQLPSEAAYPDMPTNAIRYDGPVDLIAPVSQLADEICRLAGAIPALPRA
jgi:two-component system chemotaxis response regulator CheB